MKFHIDSMNIIQSPLRECKSREEKYISYTQKFNLFFTNPSVCTWSISGSYSLLYVGSFSLREVKIIIQTFQPKNEKLDHIQMIKVSTELQKHQSTENFIWKRYVIQNIRKIIYKLWHIYEQVNNLLSKAQLQWLTCKLQGFWIILSKYTYC